MPKRKKRHLTAEDLYRFQVVTDGQISPDGRFVVFCLWRVDQKSQEQYSNLWLVATDRGAARQFTYGDQVDTQPRWSPDGRQIAFISNRRDKKQSQLYIIPVDGGEARPVTKLKGSFGSLDWSPDGRRFVCSFRLKDKELLEREADAQRQELGVVARHITRLMYKADGYGFLPQERWHIRTIEARSGRSKQLTEGEIYDDYDPQWSPDGRSILFVSNRSDDPDQTWDLDDLFLLPASGGEPKKLELPPGPKSMPRFSPDGQWLAYYHHGGRDALWKNSSLWLASVAGDPQPRNLTEALDLHVGQETLNDMDKIETSPPLWSSDGQSLFFQGTYHGDTVLKSIEIGDGQVRDVVDGRGVIGSVHSDREGRQLIYQQGTMTGLAQLWLYNMSNGRTRQLTRFNQTLLGSIDLGEVEEVWIKGAADNDLQGWLLKPPGFDETRLYPSILEIHGGPMTQYGNFFMHEFFYLAAQGYVVHFCNPRGGLGYGEAHTKAISNDWGNVDYADLMAWTDVVQAKSYIDPDRMGVTGGSYGGFMTSWIIGHTDRFKAAVTQRSVSNMISMTGSSDLGNIMEALLGADTTVWDDLDTFWRQSPLKYIGNVKTPTLVIHGEQDLRCDIEQGEQIFVALKKLGVDTELVRFPDESHGLSRAGRTDRRIVRLNHILRWFDRYL